MKKLAVFVPLLLFVLLGIFLAQGLYRDPNAMPSALIDKSLPDFELRKLQHPEQQVTHNQLKGAPLLLNVWATWCVACRVEHPFLNQLAKSGIPIVGINYKDDPAAAIRWLQHEGDPYQFSVMDLNGRLGFDLGVFGAPETYLLDAKGVIRYKHVGVLDKQVWQRELEPLWEKFSSSGEAAQ